MKAKGCLESCHFFLNNTTKSHFNFTKCLQFTEGPKKHLFSLTKSKLMNSSFTTFILSCKLSDRLTYKKKLTGLWQFLLCSKCIQELFRLILFPGHCYSHCSSRVKLKIAFYQNYTSIKHTKEIWWITRNWETKKNLPCPDPKTIILTTRKVDKIREGFITKQVSSVTKCVLPEYNLTQFLGCYLFFGE